MTSVDTAPAELGSSHRNVWRGAWIAAALAAIACIALADRNGLWLDEYFTLMSVRLNWSAMLRERLAAGHSPLPFIYAAAFHALDDSERVLRLGSALAIGAAVLGMTRLALKMGLERALRPLWVLCVVSPFWLSIGTQFRYMALLLAVETFAVSAAADHARDGSGKSGLLLFAWMTLMLWLHASAQYVAVALGAFLLWEALAKGKPRAKPIIEALWPVVGALVMSVPLLVLISGHSIPNNRKAPFAYAWIGQFTETYFGNETLWPRVLQSRGFLPDVRLDLGLVGLAILVLALAAAFAWKELDGVRRRPVRLVIALAGGIAASQGIMALARQNVRISASYLVGLSIPIVLVLAVGWQARVELRWKVLFRGLLIMLLGAQTLAVALDKGRMHREAVRWVVEQHTGREPVVISTGDVNMLAFNRAEFNNRRNLIEIPRLQMDTGRVEEIIRTNCRSASRGFILLYATRAPIGKVVESLYKGGFFREYRHWHITKEVQVIAWIRSRNELEWLDKLEPPLPNGPAVGND